MSSRREQFLSWYEAAVVDARSDIRWFRKMFLKIFKRYPATYREDFCGTFQHSVEWIKINRNNKAWGLDLDSIPLRYGMKTHFEPLKAFQKSRLKILQKDVRGRLPARVDLTSALNFSYCIFKTRTELRDYFKTVYRSLNPKGLFLLDAMGGTQLQEPSKDSRRIAKTKTTPALDYFWEQKTFDPISHQAKFAIHFREKGKRKIHRNAFTYDWRIWTLPELKEILIEAGFDEVKIFLEGTTRRGQGNGVFTERYKGEACEVWIANILAIRRH